MESLHHGVTRLRIVTGRHQGSGFAECDFLRKAWAAQRAATQHRSHLGAHFVCHQAKSPGGGICHSVFCLCALRRFKALT